MNTFWSEDDEHKLLGLLAARRDMLAHRPGVRGHSFDHPRAASLYQARRLRDVCFPGVRALLREPAWDILLDLHAALEGNVEVSVWSACLGACVPVTSARRSLRRLEALGLVEKGGSGEDRRVCLVRLTPTAVAMMDRYLARLEQ